MNGHCHLAVNTKPMNIQQRYIRLMQDGSSVLLALAYRQIPFPATKNRGRHLDAKSIVAKKKALFWTFAYSVGRSNRRM